MIKTYGKIVVLLALMLITVSAVAGEKGHVGLRISAQTSGFFSRELTRVLIEEVEPGSPAEQSGLKKGYTIESIDGCDIPGCPVKQAKETLGIAPGESVGLLVKKTDGELETFKITAD